MEKSAVIKVAEDDPRRCQGGRGKFSQQCGNQALEGSTHCPICIGPQRGAMARERIGVYNLTKWRDRVSHLSDSDAVRSLRDEIGMMRMVFESLWNSCQSESDLLINSTKMIDLTNKIEHLLIACQKLEKSTGMMLDKSAALQIAGNIVNVISNHIDDPDKIEAIADEIIERVLNVEFTGESK